MKARRRRAPAPRPAAARLPSLSPRVRVAVSAWLRLLRIQALLEREIRRELGDGFTLPQFDVLNQLARRPEGMTFVELSRQLLVTAGNLTGIVDRLERDRLVRRRPHPEDRRAVCLTLTPHGRKAVNQTVPVHHATIARLMTNLSGRDLRSLRGLLGRLRDRLEGRLTPASPRK